MSAVITEQNGRGMGKKPHLHGQKHQKNYLDSHMCCFVDNIAVETKRDCCNDVDGATQCSTDNGECWSFYFIIIILLLFYFYYVFLCLFILSASLYVKICLNNNILFVILFGEIFVDVLLSGGIVSFHIRVDVD